LLYCPIIRYHPLNDSRRTEKSKPDNTSELNWSLGDFEIDEQRVIELNVSCNDSDTGCISQVEASGKAVFIDYLISAENKGETRLTGVVLNCTLPERTQYFGSRYAKKSEDSGSLPEPTIISNPDGTTKMLSWFLGDLETGAIKRIELSVSCLDYNCTPNESVVEASGMTSIIHKIPISVNSTTWSMNVSKTSINNSTFMNVSKPADEEEKSDQIAPPSPPPEGNYTEMKGTEVNDTAVNTSAIDFPRPEMTSPGL